MARTPLDLFHVGNKTSARFEKVRPDDLTHFSQNQRIWVRAGTGGKSTWEAPNQALAGTWWRLPAGTDFDDVTLLIVNDFQGHWSWEPRRDVPLDDYIDALATVNGKFVRV